MTMASSVFLKSSDSSIDVSSQFGLSGAVRITAPDIDITAGLTRLPAEVIGAGARLQESCARRFTLGEGYSSFITTGRGGLPPEPEMAVPDLSLSPARDGNGD